MQLKLNDKIYICFEANQYSDSPILQRKKPKPQHTVNFDPKKFSIYYSLFKILPTPTQDEQQDSVDEEIEPETT